MLATILKGEVAATATLAIVQTFAKVRALKRELLALHNDAMPVKQKTSMLKHFGEQTVASLCSAIETFEASAASFKPADCRARAAEFTSAVFGQSFVRCLA